MPQISVTQGSTGIEAEQFLNRVTGLTLRLCIYADKFHGIKLPLCSVKTTMAHD